MLVNEIYGFHRVLSVLDAADEVVLDTETTGVTPFLGSRLCGISLRADGESFYLPYRHAEGQNLPMVTLPALLDVLVGKHLVLFNSKFDLHMLHQDGFPYPAPGEFEDVILAAHLLNENERSFALKSLCNKYEIGVGSADEEDLKDVVIERFKLRKKSEWKGHMWRLRPEEVARYAESDVDLTEDLRDFYLPYLNEWGLLDLWDECNEYARVLARLESRGLLIDRVALDRCIDEMEAAIAPVLAELREAAGKPDLNPNSPTQLRAAFGWPGTAADILRDIKTRESELVQTYRLMRNRLDRYYYPYRDTFLSPESLLFPNFNMTRVISARLSSDKPNLQAVPRSTDEPQTVKEVFIARKNKKLIEVDINQAELRVACWFGKEKNMADILARGGDIHGETSSTLKVDRSTAKRGNFSATYGIGAKTFSETYGYSEEFARDFLNKYHQLYPGFRRLYYACERRAKEYKYIRLPTGRVRRYNVPKFHNGRMDYGYHRASSNLVQGTVAEIMRVAMTRVERELPEVDMLLQVHDSLLCEVDEGREVEMAREIVRIMTDSRPVFGCEIYPPLAADAKVGDRWSTLTKVQKEG